MQVKCYFILITNICSICSAKVKNTSIQNETIYYIIQNIPRITAEA